MDIEKSRPVEKSISDGVYLKAVLFRLGKSLAAERLVEFEGFGSLHIFASSSITRFCGRVPIHGRSRALQWLHLRMHEVPVLILSGYTLRS
jgi:hypothetical protein